MGKIEEGVLGGRREPSEGVGMRSGGGRNEDNGKTRDLNKNGVPRRCQKISDKKLCGGDARAGEGEVWGPLRPKNQSTNQYQRAINYIGTLPWPRSGSGAGLKKFVF